MHIQYTSQLCTVHRVGSKHPRYTPGTPQIHWIHYAGSSTVCAPVFASRFVPGDLTFTKPSCLCASEYTHMFGFFLGNMSTYDGILYRENYSFLHYINLLNIVTCIQNPFHTADHKHCRISNRPTKQKHSKIRSSIHI